MIERVIGSIREFVSRDAGQGTVYVEPPPGARTECPFYVDGDTNQMNNRVFVPADEIGMNGACTAPFSGKKYDDCEYPVNPWQCPRNTRLDLCENTAYHT